MKYIPLTKGYWATVDDDDYERVNKLKWREQNGYAIHSKQVKGWRTIVAMHRFVLNVEKDVEAVDHINGNRLDNRKCNLRCATQAENLRNHHTWSNATGYKGVYLTRGSKSHPFVARIKAGGKSIYLGRFASEAKAAKAYNKAALKYHGEFASLNPII